MATRVGPYEIEAVTAGGDWLLSDGSTLTAAQRLQVISDGLAAAQRTADDGAEYIDQGNPGFAAATRMLEHQVAVERLLAAQGIEVR